MYKIVNMLVGLSLFFKYKNKRQCQAHGKVVWEKMLVMIESFVYAKLA